MISNTDTVQTLTLGMAFLALFIGSIASLSPTSEDALYITKADAPRTQASDSASAQVVTTDATSSSFGWSAVFSSVALAANTTADDQLAIDTTLAQLEPATSLAKKVSENTPKEIHQQAQERATRSQTDNPVMSQTDKREILWLARIMYSETKRADEQLLIGWVVRNRVETGYTGRTYEDVAKHSRQFSGLNPYDNRYEHNISRWSSSDGRPWQTALAQAKEIYFADESARPFSLTTRHFYSPNAVSRTPSWAQNREAIQVIKDPYTDQVRFALYDQIR